MEINISIVNGSAVDRRGMVYAVSQENERRRLAVPPEQTLPSSTNAELKASYESILRQRAMDEHAANIEMSDRETLQGIKAAWKSASDGQRAAAVAALRGAD